MAAPKKEHPKEFIYGIRVDARTRERMRLAEGRVNWSDFLRNVIIGKLAILAGAKTKRESNELK